jgi:deoxyadenosine/deoxycytidine kinase
MTMKRDQDAPLIAVVGPCASGKTTLVDALAAHGFDARQIAQEHSYVPDMWEIITQPDVLIYLDASFEKCTLRKNLDWSPDEYQKQVERLSYARERCDLYIDTENSKPRDVEQAALNFLKRLVK